MKKNIIVLSFLLCLTFVFSQSSNTWEQLCNTLSTNDANFKAVVYFHDEQKEVVGEEATTLWQACLNFELLTNPTCRCLPDPQGKVEFYFSDEQVITIEIVVDHWFNGNYASKECIGSFLFLDANNQFFSMVENLMKRSQASNEPYLCPECAGKMFIASLGTCLECSGITSSGAFKFCTTCAREKSVCQACGKSMK